ncbi:CDP-alcohol phosphatidyltransferase [compost metagenome]
MSSETVENRRQVATRDAKWAQKAAAFLARKGLSPNQISVLSMAFGLLALGAYVSASFAAEGKAAYLILAIVGIQGRLLCNLFDGMVAIEFHKKSAVGEIYNDAPDRISDFLILLGAGFLIPNSLGGLNLAWAAVFLATLTAYARMMGASVGAGHQFLGPMAKQHRMALITVATVIEIFNGDGLVMAGAFAVMIVLLVVTNVRRISKIASFLNSKEIK